MGVEQVHELSDGEMHFHKHPDAEVAEASRAQLLDRTQKQQELAAFLETTPNLNEKYSGELESVHDLFEQDGFAIAPITILGEDDYARAQEVFYGATTTDTKEQGAAGWYVNGHILIKEYPLAEVTFRASQYITTIALHEAAHSTMGATRDVVINEAIGGLKHTITATEIGASINPSELLRR